jgi:hypothetical protein
MTNLLVRGLLGDGDVAIVLRHDWVELRSGLRLHLDGHTKDLLLTSGSRVIHKSNIEGRVGGRGGLGNLMHVSEDNHLLIRLNLSSLLGLAAPSTRELKVNDISKLVRRWQRAETGQRE